MTFSFGKRSVNPKIIQHRKQCDNHPSQGGFMFGDPNKLEILAPVPNDEKVSSPRPNLQDMDIGEQFQLIQLQLHIQ